MATCFVIQPFDQDRFDKRYADTFKPAIEAAGLEPYRVDQDPGVAIPIEEIESGIRRADACFAEISTDNPNVWFELGFAIAARKPIVMVCGVERSKFPFDVQHRTIIGYKTDSPSDFQRLGVEITDRLRAAVKRQLELEDVADIATISPTEGLSVAEIGTLVAVVSGGGQPGYPASPWEIRQDMNRAGFNNAAVAIGLRALLRKGLISQTSAMDERGNEYDAYEGTDLGYGWLEKNQDKVVTHRPPESGNELPY